MPSKGIYLSTKIAKNKLPSDKMDKNMSHETDKMAQVAVWHMLRRNKAENYKCLNLKENRL